ncbi:MAG: hypothetical protein V2B15_09530 [Bacteroidota bacterium]
MNGKPKLRPKLDSLPELVGRYEYASEVDLFLLKPQIVKRGYMTKKELHEVALWKSPRSAGHILKNSDRFIEEITGFALYATDERSHIEILCVLNGVSWPTASVILHHFHNDPYPIIDFRALYSLSLDVPSSYTFQFWWDYVVCCRELALKTSMSMRELDQALWQYSKENQEPNN